MTKKVNPQILERITHPHPKRNFVPSAVLMKSGLKTLNTARQNSLRAAVSVSTARPINTAYPRPTVNSARPVSNGNPQQDLKDKGVIDSGCSRHMIGNKSYLIDYEEIDRGFVAFRGNSKGGKITGKGKIRTSKLDFEDMYFVKELNFNHFSVSQMCDKKISILCTDTECAVLSPDFKLTDKSYVLLKVSRKDNMYSVDLKNVGNPHQDLKDKGVIDSGCSRHMTGNRFYLTDYEEIDGGFVAFRELKFNLFSISQMCDKKNSILFTDTGCVVLSPVFKLTDESHVMLKVPRKDNMYSVDLKNVVL
ncbi:hypothetical protein Tco_0007532 [Tanacetum coccineum]